MLKKSGFFLIIICIALTAPALVFSKFRFNTDWRAANRDSVGIAPTPATTPEAIVQIYSARAFNWRGLFSVHTWIATKPANAENFTVHQVLGWNVAKGRSAVVSRRDLPDRRWYDAEPNLIADIRGDEAEALIQPILEAVRQYPYTDEYRMWPGPNSNTFVANIIRKIPRLNVEMPATAIGKDYLADGMVFGAAPSGSGWQFSIRGVFGILIAKDEGFEVNILGLIFGINFIQPALKFPGIGRVGFSPTT